MARCIFLLNTGIEPEPAILSHYLSTPLPLMLLKMYLKLCELHG